MYAVFIFQQHPFIHLLLHGNVNLFLKKTFQPESPVNLGSEESSYLLTGNGGSDSQEENPLRDLSLWVVSIPSILTKVDPIDPNNPKKYFYVFKVEIKRLAEERENTGEDLKLLNH